MHAIRQYDLGEPEVLRYETADDPGPGSGQVRIAVRAAGVHFIDTAIRRGTAPPFARATLPMTPGREVAGIVDAVGEGVDASWVGRRVVAHLGLVSGGYAELAIAAAEALHVVPDGLGDDAAVAMIGTGRTTLSILDIAAPGPRDIVVITAAAGGIGSLLVQAARRADALVVALAGGDEKLATARRLGADIAIDYRAADWPEQVAEQLTWGRPTLAYDGVGGDVGAALTTLLDGDAHHVVFGAAGGDLAGVGQPSRDAGPSAASSAPSSTLTATAAPRTTYAVGPSAPPAKRTQRELEAAALRAAVDGTLVPLIHPPFELADAAAAHAALETRQTAGKVVLRPYPLG
jgi:NADPH2:quinone reductase